MHICMPHHTSSLLVIHGLNLIAPAMRHTYCCAACCSTHGLPAFPQHAAGSLPMLFSLPALDCLPGRCLALGTWSVEGLTNAPEKLEMESCRGLSSTLLQVKSHMRLLQHPCMCLGVKSLAALGLVGGRGVVGFLILSALLPEVKFCTNATPQEYLWHSCCWPQGGTESVRVECVHMPSVAVA